MFKMFMLSTFQTIKFAGFVIRKSKIEPFDMLRDRIENFIITFSLFLDSNYPLYKLYEAIPF